MFKITCSDGFRAPEHDAYICNRDNGEWSPELPTKDEFPSCISGESECDVRPTAPENGYIICKTEDGVKECTPYCKENFALDMPAPKKFTCVMGMWVPLLGTDNLCVRKYLCTLRADLSLRHVS